MAYHNIRKGMKKKNMKKTMMKKAGKTMPREAMRQKVRPATEKSKMLEDKLADKEL